MFKKKTLVVVGAGASCEVDLPDGKKLTSTIAQMLNIELGDFGKLTGGDPAVRETLRIMAIEVAEKNPGGPPANARPYVDAAQMIRDAMPLAESIDNFIDTHKGDASIEGCGKLAIVQSILHAEKESHLYFENIGLNSNIDYKDIQNTWFIEFYQLLTKNCGKEDLAKRFDSLVMIIFNYDRCVEHFLVNSIRTYYGIDAKEAAELVNRIEIYHPYGKVGHLPWQKHKKGGGVIDFGAKTNPAILIKLSEQIRTFTEGTDQGSSEISAIREHVKSSEIVIFLGFAFHALNLKLLKPESGGSKAMCFATAKDISEHDCIIIKKELAKLKPLNVICLRNDLSCSKLFQEYSRSLSYT
ncbi:MAG: hypothetical protein V3W31_00680 [Thermodesulfobacteriota bacterium]